MLYANAILRGCIDVNGSQTAAVTSPLRVIPVGRGVDVFQFQQLLFFCGGAVVAGDESVTERLQFLGNGILGSSRNVGERHTFFFGQLIHHSQVNR